MHQLLDGPITWHPQAPRSPNHPRCPSASSEPPKITGAEIWSWNQPLWGWETNIAMMGKLQVLPGSCGRPLWWWRHACYVGQQNWTNKYNGVVLLSGQSNVFLRGQSADWPISKIHATNDLHMYAVCAYLCSPMCLYTYLSIYPQIGQKMVVALRLKFWRDGARSCRFFVLHAGH